MDTGKLNDYTFYIGYEGEPELVLWTSEDGSKKLHVWDGYLTDIFDNAALSDLGWRGLTRDYQEDLGAFADSDEHIVEDVEAYLGDLRNYIGCSFRFEETEQVLISLINIFEQAISTENSVIMKME